MSAINGACLCGKITFNVDAPSLDQIELGAQISKENGKYQAYNCFCSICATSGSSFSQIYFMAARTAVHVTDNEKVLKTYESSPGIGNRSFCSNCGSSLFFQLVDGTWIDVSVAACNREEFDKSAEFAGHMFTKSCMLPNYPDHINDGRIKFEDYPAPPPEEK